MKYLQKLVFLIVTVFLPISLFSQTDLTENSFTLGLGVAVDLSHFSIPINIISKYRLEPEINLILLNRERDDTESKSTILDVGVGFFSLHAFDQFNIYYGIRTGYSLLDSETKREGSDPSTSKTNGFYFSPAVGSEFYPIDRFSLGAELIFHYSSLNIKSSGEEEEGSLWTLRTLGRVYVRFFIW